MRRLIPVLLIILLACNVASGGFGGFLQANTAVDVIVGPFIDDTDGKTAETGLTITQAECRISKNGANTIQKNEATSLTHDELGNYVCKFDTTDTDTEGILTLMVHESGALAVKVDYQVLAHPPYISFMTAKDTGYMGVDVEEVDGTDQTGNDNGADINILITQIGTAGDGLTAINLPNQTMDITGNLSGSVGSLTGHTNQTADHTSALTTIDNFIDTEIGTIVTAVGNIEADTEAQDTTTKLRTLLTGADTPVCKESTPLTAAETEAEAYDAIELANLDHWMKVVTSNSATLPEVVDDTVLANILTKTDGDTSDYDFTKHSYEAIRDRGDAAWTTGGGTGLTPLASDTAQGGSASTIQLAAGESFANDELNGNVVLIHTGTGAGQSRLIYDYTNANDTADVTPNWTTNPDNTSQYEVWPASVNVERIERTDATDAINAAADAAIVTYELDHLVHVADSDDPADNSIVAKMFASDGDWSGGSAATDALEAIADAIAGFLSGAGVNLTAIEGHALAGTGNQIADGFEYFFDVGTPGKTLNDVGLGGAVINTVYNIPSVIDIAGTATVRFGMSVTDCVDDLPSTVEITPGTIKIETKRINGISWATIVDDEACSEAAGLIYYDEIFNTASGYREEDALRITFKSQKVVIGGNDFEINGTGGATFHSYIRKALPDVIYMPVR